MSQYLSRTPKKVSQISLPLTHASIKTTPNRSCTPKFTRLDLTTVLKPNNTTTNNNAKQSLKDLNLHLPISPRSTMTPREPQIAKNVIKMECAIQNLQESLQAINHITQEIHTQSEQQQQQNNILQNDQNISYLQQQKTPKNVQSLLNSSNYLNQANNFHQITEKKKLKIETFTEEQQQQYQTKLNGCVSGCNNNILTTKNNNNKLKRSQSKGNPIGQKSVKIYHYQDQNQQFQELQYYTQTIESQQKLIFKQQRKLEELKEMLEYCVNQIKDDQDQLSTQKDEIQDHKDQISQKDLEIDSLEKKHSELQEQLKIQKNQYVLEIQQLYKENLEKEKEICLLNQKNAQLEDNLKTCEIETDSMISKIKLLETLNKNNKSIQDMQNKMKSQFYNNNTNNNEISSQDSNQESEQNKKLRRHSVHEKCLEEYQKQENKRSNSVKPLKRSKKIEKIEKKVQFQPKSEEVQEDKDNFSENFSFCQQKPKNNQVKEQAQTEFYKLMGFGSSPEKKNQSGNSLLCLQKIQNIQEFINNDSLLLK